MKAAFPRGRRLHLVDVENLLGLPGPTSTEVAACHDRYAKLVGLRRGDQCVVACSHKVGAEVGCGWPDARYLWRSGPDGADLALIDVLGHESVGDRFETVFVASGDGIFAGPVAHLGCQGVLVMVVANQNSLSRRLKFAAGRVVLFDTEPLPAAPAAVSLWAAA